MPVAAHECFVFMVKTCASLTLEEKVQAFGFLSHKVLNERSSFYVTMSLEYSLEEFLGLSDNFTLRIDILAVNKLQLIRA